MPHSRSTLGKEPDVDTASEDYATRFAGAVGHWFLGRQWRAVKRGLKIRSQDPLVVVDVGGGHGQITSQLIAEGARVIVHGSDPRCAARIQLLLDSEQCEFVVSPTTALPFADQSITVVTSLRLLPHSSDWRALISEMCRISKDLVILDYPTWQSANIFSKSLFSLKKKIERNTREFLLFSHAEVSRQFSELGFEVVRREGQFVIPMALHRTLKSLRLCRLLEALCSPIRDVFGSPVIVTAKRRV